MHIKISKKSYSERLKSPAKLKTCGESIPRIFIGEMLEKDYVNLLVVGDKEWEEEWRGKTLRDYCMYIVCLWKKGELDSLQKDSCGNLIRILKEKIKTMKAGLEEIEKNEEKFGINPKELYHRILGFLRAVECIEVNKDNPFIKIERLAPAVPMGYTNFPPRENK